MAIVILAQQISNVRFFVYGGPTPKLLGVRLPHQSFKPYAHQKFEILHFGSIIFFYAGGLPITILNLKLGLETRLAS
jgi:hypothetical protein